MKKKILLIIIIAVVIVTGFILATLKKSDLIGEEDVITSSELKEAIDISELSTAEFVYNGVAEKHNEKKPEKVDCYISYNANVKVGIQMKDVEFNIDKEKKIISPVLPEISVNIATLDEKEISYIPQNPDIPLNEIIAICKEDAVNEANNSEKLYETAKENLQTTIEALLSPILNSNGYAINWQ